MPLSILNGNFFCSYKNKLPFYKRYKRNIKWHSREKKKLIIIEQIDHVRKILNKTLKYKDKLNY